MKLPLQTLAISLVLSCAVPRLAAAHSAVDPVPRNDGWWQERHKLINQRVSEAGEKAQVIFIGDSITQGWEGAGKETWERSYAPRHAVNLGISGDRTQHVLWRLENGNLEGIKPKAAVVMIGTNNSNGEDNTPGQIVEGVTAIVKKLRDKLPGTKVVLLGIFPRSENYSAQRGKLAQVNQVLRKLADNENIYWVDFGHRFLNSDGTIPAALMPDYLHLSKRGYEVWAQALERRLSAILGDQPVSSTATQRPNLEGEWVSILRSDDGQEFESRLVLDSANGKVTGKFSRGDEGWLEIQNGQLSGQELSWNVKRDRPDGSVITYRMSGTVKGNEISGVAKAQIDGGERSMNWTARRK